MSKKKTNKKKKKKKSLPASEIVSHHKIRHCSRLVSNTITVHQINLHTYRFINYTGMLWKHHWWVRMVGDSAIHVIFLTVNCNKYESDWMLDWDTVLFLYFYLKICFSIPTYRKPGADMELYFLIKCFQHFPCGGGGGVKINWTLDFCILQITVLIS